jgi:hypothetical protein
MFIYPRFRKDRNGLWLHWIAPFNLKYTRLRFAVGTKLNRRNIRRYILAGIGLVFFKQGRYYL